MYIILYICSPDCLYVHHMNAVAVVATGVSDVGLESQGVVCLLTWVLR